MTKSDEADEGGGVFEGAAQALASVADDQPAFGPRAVPSLGGEAFVPREVPILIKLDAGFLMRIEAEREAVTGGTGHRIPRTAMLRMLLKEALDERARKRNERVPEAVVVGRLISATS